MPTAPKNVQRGDDEIDTMVARASTPTLGELMRSAVNKGLITPVPGYTDATQKLVDQLGPRVA